MPTSPSDSSPETPTELPPSRGLYGFWIFLGGIIIFVLIYLAVFYRWYGGYGQMGMWDMPYGPMGTMMGGRYRDTTRPLIPGSTSTKTLNSTILTEDDSVRDEKPTEIVSLKNGDTYDLTIGKVRKTINGSKQIMLAYNGSIPGPTIRVAKGSEITLRVRNSVTGLETTIHPHGVRLENQFDGVPGDQGGFQDPIRIGDTYDQRIKFPDVGIFWYHSHMRDDFEQELGEYGTFLVYDPLEQPTYDSESVLVLDDILITNGRVTDFPTDVVDHAMMGRFGNIFLVNGQTNYTLTMNAGAVRRLYILNSANARPYRLSIPGVQMKLVGGDIGYYQQETIIESLIIAPAERYIVDISASKSGHYTLTHLGGYDPVALATIDVLTSSGSSIHSGDFATLHTHDILGTLSGSIAASYSKIPDKSLTISMTMNGMGGMMGGMGNMGMGMGGIMGSGGMGMMGSDDPIEWEDTMGMMNNQSDSQNILWTFTDDATRKTNMDIDWQFRKGDLVKIRISNDANSMHAMQHPFHMHGQRFVVLDTNGKQSTNLVWKDTILIPRGEYVDILVDMSNPGTWMAHCHIAEHLLSGLTMQYRVTE